MSFIASSNCIIHARGVPEFADISMKDYCLDPQEVEARAKKGTQGIIPVHLYGQPVDFDAFNSVAEQKGMKIVEDACQAHGAKYKGKMVGSLGIAAAFSFYPSKNMTVLGDGGMVTTNDEGIAKACRKLRDSGRVSKYEHDIIGYTARMNSVSAAIGRVQLRHLSAWNEKRRDIAKRYSAKLKSISGLVLPPMPSKDYTPVFHQFVITTANRDKLKEHLEANGIEAGIHYPIPIHLQPIYKKMYGFKEGDFKNSERLAKECLSLPMHVLLTDEQASYICETIQSFFAK